MAEQCIVVPAVSIHMCRGAGGACIQQGIACPLARAVDGGGCAAAPLPGQSAGDLDRIEAVQATVGKKVDPLILIVPVGRRGLILVIGIVGGKVLFGVFLPDTVIRLIEKIAAPKIRMVTNVIGKIHASRLGGGNGLITGPEALYRNAGIIAIQRHPAAAAAADAAIVKAHHILEGKTLFVRVIPQAEGRKLLVA